MTQTLVAKKAGWALALAAAGLALSVPVLAQSGPGGAPYSGRAETLQQLTECRKITDPSARLACYDAASAAIESAETSGDLVVMDRRQIREAKRSLFGFDASALNIFDRGSSPEIIDNVTLTIDRAYLGDGGKWVLVMDDGQVWRQVDTESVSRDPRKGSKAEIRRAALGSYFLKIDGQRSIRARREK